MRRLAALAILLIATTAHAQYPGPYAPYQPAYPPQGPIYIPEPGHAANDAPAYPPPQPGYGNAEPTQPYGAPPTELAPPPLPPPLPPEQPEASPPAYNAPRITPASLAYQLLAPQNAVRASVGDPPLHWSAQLAAVAGRWAEHLVATGQFAHRVGDRYGENLYEITGGIAAPQQVVAAWADEARDYDLRSNTCSGMCGHYTQIVWRTTRAVGCAVAAAADRQVWVCEYDPAGNWVGYRPY